VGRAIAGALSAVHQEGLLHRDVKPSNILIRQDGVPLLTDFGLARDQHATLVTQDGQFLGTPAYASPEQLRGEAALDARSDVYSLGATLYHALALRVPFEGPNTSAILNGIEAGRVTPLRKLDRRVPRDLETIIAKAMDAVPARRYASAAELAEDLERLLSLRPIRARRAGVIGRGWRFARRNRALVTGAAIALVATSGAIGFGVRQRLQEQAERSKHASELKAQENRVSAARTVADFAAEVLHELETRRAAGEDIQRALTNSSEVIQKAAAMIGDAGFGFDAGAQGKYHRELAHLCFYSLGLLGTAQRHYSTALERFASLGPEGENGYVETEVQLAECLGLMGRPKEGAAYWDHAAAWLRAHDLGKTSEMAFALEGVAGAQSGEGQFDAAAESLKEAVAIRRGLNTGPSIGLAHALNLLGDCLWRAQHMEESEAALREAMATCRALQPPEAKTSVVSKRYLARVLKAQRKLDESKALLLEVLPEGIAAYGRNHSEVATILCELAKLETAERQYEAAEGHLKEALDICHHTVRQFPRNEYTVHALLAGVYQQMGGRDEDAARERLAAEDAKRREVGGPDAGNRN
jgi:tetratricopeptide (TPR) repeat protein